jgi:hypothetical protein
MMPSACSTLERSSAFAGAAVVGAMLLTPTALGQAAPPAHIEIHVNGAMVASFDQPPDLADDGALLYEGALDEDTAGWAVAWSFEFDPDADDDRSLAGEAEFLNTGGQSKEYRFELSVPVCPWIEHSSSIGGTAHLSLITDEDGGQLSSIGTNPVWAMTADDAVAHETFSAPFLFDVGDLRRAVPQRAGTRRRGCDGTATAIPPHRRRARDIHEPSRARRGWERSSRV